MNLAYNFSIESINILDMALHVKHFKTEFFSRQTSAVTMVKSVHDMKARYYFNELISELLKSTYDMKYKFEDIDRGSKHVYEYFNVIFTDSYNSFR